MKIQLSWILEIFICIPVILNLIFKISNKFLVFQSLSTILEISNILIIQLRWSSAAELLTYYKN